MENIIIKSSVRGRMPTELAWVFPFPSKPISYQEVNPAVFEEMGSCFSRSFRQKGRSDFPAPGSANGGGESLGITVHAKEVVGDYEIVPIEILDAALAGRELNSWFQSQGYIELPSDIQKP